jgi:hypothetical protein
VAVKVTGSPASAEVALDETAVVVAVEFTVCVNGLEELVA